MVGFKLKIKNIEWVIAFLPQESEWLANPVTKLQERAITNYEMATIFIRNTLSPQLVIPTFMHEITHAVLYSNLLVVPNKFTEEEVCNLISQYLDDFISYREVFRGFLDHLEQEANKKETPETVEAID